MKHPNEALLLQIEALLQKRLELLKQYPSLSVEAMQLLENREISEFNLKLDQRSELASQVDAISNEIVALSSRMDSESSNAIVSILSSDDHATDFPPWVSGIARNMERTHKLLHNCVLFDAKLISQAKAAHADIEAHLTGLQAQKKIQSGYADNHAASSGLRNHISTK